MNIAFLIYGVNSLNGGGGAERFFSDFFDQYNKYKKRQFNLYFILDNLSKNNLQDINKLKQENNLLNFKIVSNRFKYVVEAFQIIFYIFIKRIKIIHIPLYDHTYLPILKIISRLPKSVRPKLVINMVNCYVVPGLIDSNNSYHDLINKVYTPLFNELKVDGYFCWNKSFEDYAKVNKIFKIQPGLIQSITSRFCDVSNFFPEINKQHHIVFASRLDEQKHPEWIIAAIRLIMSKSPKTLATWKIIICGDGPLRSQLMQTVKNFQLQNQIEFRIENQLYRVLNKSKIYISCQDYDNFPSLSMAEAMASGNAIIARPVGQTSLFVKNNYNGILIEPDTVEGLADAIIELLENAKLISVMGNNSVQLMKSVHTFENFVPQIESFWLKMVNLN